MGRKDPRIDRYIAQAAPFARPILKHFRKVMHAGCPQIEETIKWGMPHFEYKGILAGMGAFKEHCAFGFWKSSSVFGPGNGELGAMGQFGRITSLADLPTEETLIGYVRKAAELNETGAKVPARKKPKTTRAPLEIPQALTAALAKNRKARTTFDALSYSHRKEYVDWLNEAKRPETRTKRLATTLEWLADGKSLNWKYERC